MAVELSIKNYRCFSDERPVRLSLNKGFTAFVGANNSGKSTILKFFYEFRSLFTSVSSGRNEFEAALMGNSRDLEVPPNVYEKIELFNNSNTRDIHIEMSFTELDDDALLMQPAKLVVTVSRGEHSWRAEVWDRKGKKIDVEPGAVLGLQSQRADGKKLVDFSHIVSLFETMSKAMYVGPFRQIGSFKAQPPSPRGTMTFTRPQDIEVGQDFIDLWRHAQAGGKKESKAIERVTQDVRRIFKFKSLSIYPTPNNETLHVTINGEGFKLQEVGSGLGQFILVLGNAAIKRPSYILIDEPESNLHPALQRDFVDILGTYAQEGVMFATHSYGLARATAQPVYTLRVSDSGERELGALEALSSLSEFFGELSFSEHQELGFEKILLVEGPTDAPAIRQMLRRLNKDQSVVVIPLGGRSLINGKCGAQLEEMKRICTKISALIDSERSSETSAPAENAVAFKGVCEKAKINCVVLQRRALENYFPESAIRKIKGEKYRALGPFESLSDCPVPWAKEENAKIAGAIAHAELKGTDLGKFLEEL